MVMATSSKGRGYVGTKEIIIYSSCWSPMNGDNDRDHEVDKSDEDDDDDNDIDNDHMLQ